MATASSPNPYLASSSPSHQQHERAYTLGGDGYGASSVPPLQQQQDYDYGHSSSSGFYGSQQPSASAINTNVGGFVQPHTPSSPVKGPRAQPGSMFPEEAPPGYDSGTSGITGNWGKL